MLIKHTFFNAMLRLNLKNEQNIGIQKILPIYSQTSFPHVRTLKTVVSVNC